MKDLLAQASEAGGFEALPAGEYHVQVEEASAKTAKTGNLMIVAEFRVVAGPYKKRKLWNNFVFAASNPNALAMTFRQLAILGADNEFMQGDPTPDQIAQKIKGARATAKVSQREWKGETRNDVDRISAPDPSVDAEVDYASGGGDTPSPSPQPQKNSGGPPKPPF